MTDAHLPRPNATAVDAPSTVENIQALRGIAAFLVVWQHLKYPLLGLCHQVVDYPVIHTSHGAIGVDLFFIISGYVICLTAATRNSRSLDFFCARVARVSPLYLAVFILPFLGARYISWPQVSFNSVWNEIFYLPVFDWRDYTAPTLAAGWTLSFEMWFYVVFAVLLNLWPARKVAVALPVVFFIGAPLMMFYHGAWYFPRFSCHPFVLEFAFGCLVFQTQKWVTARTAWVLLFSGVFYMLAFSRGTGYLGWQGDLLSARLDLAWLRVLLWGLPSAFMVAGLVGLERNRGFVLPRALVWLGGISYSLYLTHQFSMNLVLRIGQRIGLHNPLISILAVLVVCIFIGWLCCEWIEQPLTQRAQRWAKKWIHSAKPNTEAPIAGKPAATVS